MTTAKREQAEMGELALLREQLAAMEKRLAALEAAAAAKPAAGAPVAAKPAVEKIPWLVISAAVAAVVKKPFRITEIQLQGLPPLNVWAFEGRRSIFYSHQVRSN